MTLVDHLGELRTRLVRSILAVVAGAVLGFLAGDQIVDILKSPLPTDQPLVFTGIGDPFAIRLRIAVVAGIVLAMPMILWQGWQFVAPGLTPTERKAARPWIPLVLAFFLFGVGIAWVVLPFAAQFLLGFSTPSMQALLTAREYFDFVSTMFLAFGLLMEFPVVLVALARIGIVSSSRLRSARRPVVLGIAIFATAATPGGDLVSPAVLGLSMYLLFELSIIMIRRSGR
jgi:sec-independent protein translocase protein TatC